MRRSGAILTLGLASTIALSGCGRGGSSASSLVRSEEQAGVSHALAVCVATTAQRQLGSSIVRQLATHLDQLPPSLEVSLTQIAAECALTTVTVSGSSLSTVQGQP